MFVIKVGDRGYIGRKGGPNGYSLVGRKADARRFKSEDYANRLGLVYQEALMDDGIWATAITVPCRETKMNTDPNEEAARLEYEANLPEVTSYRYYNPHAHLLHCSFLSPTEWDRVKARLTPADLANIENGGVVRVGAAAKVWKPKARKKVA